MWNHVGLLAALLLVLILGMLFCVDAMWFYAKKGHWSKVTVELFVLFIIGSMVGTTIKEMIGP